MRKTIKIRRADSESRVERKDKFVSEARQKLRKLIIQGIEIRLMNEVTPPFFIRRKIIDSSQRDEASVSVLGEIEYSPDNFLEDMFSDLNLNDEIQFRVWTPPMQSLIHNRLSATKLFCPNLYSYKNNVRFIEESHHTLTFDYDYTFGTSVRKLMAEVLSKSANNELSNLSDYSSNGFSYFYDSINKDRVTTQQFPEIRPSIEGASYKDLMTNEWIQKDNGFFAVNFKLAIELEKVVIESLRKVLTPDFYYNLIKIGYTIKEA